MSLEHLTSYVNQAFLQFFRLMFCRRNLFILTTGIRWNQFLTWLTKQVHMRSSNDNFLLRIRIRIRIDYWWNAGITTYRNGPERTYENTETDFYEYRNGPERTSVGTETDRNRLQLIPKWTSVGTRKGRVGYDRNDPNKIMYVWVGR